LQGIFVTASLASIGRRLRAGATRLVCGLMDAGGRASAPMQPYGDAAAWQPLALGRRANGEDGRVRLLPASPNRWASPAVPHLSSRVIKLLREWHQQQQEE
jgi:hypothetical protein